MRKDEKAIIDAQSAATAVLSHGNVDYISLMDMQLWNLVGHVALRASRASKNERGE